MYILILYHRLQLNKERQDFEMGKKFLAFFTITVVLCTAVFSLYWRYVRQSEYMVFVESFDHGVITIDSDETTGTDEKFRVVCKRGETITLNINPERTDTTYYDLKKLTVNGVDVTEDVNMLQYKTTVTQKLTILASFKKGERPEDYETKSAGMDIESPDIINTFEDEYIGSYGNYDIKDPSIIYDEDSGYYYCFGSDNVVIKSTDLVNWGGRTTYFAHPDDASSNTIMSFSAFSSVSKWAKTHGYDDDESYSYSDQDRTPLAPEIIKVDGVYYLYFSISKTADANESAIFCVKTTNLASAIENKKWDDVGLVISSCGRHSGTKTVTDDDGNTSRQSVTAHYDSANAVHPNVVVTDNGIFMTYGASYGRGTVKGSIYLVELSSKTMLLKEASKYNNTGDTISTLHGTKNFSAGTLIANPGRIPALTKSDGSLLSGSELFYNKETKYYYLLLTYGNESTNYNIRVARSKNIEGPYLDMNGNSMQEFSTSANQNQYTKGTLLLGGYTFDWSSAGSVEYSNTGRASIGSPSIIISENGELIMASQSQLYYKADSTILTGAAKAEELGINANSDPSLELRKISWTTDGWPMAAPEAYAGYSEDITVKAKNLYGNWDVIVFDASGSSSDYTEVERSTSSIVSIYKSAVVTQTDISKGRQLNTTGSFSKQDGYYTITIDSVQYKVYPSAMWDWELDEGSIFFTGYGEDGSTIWGKKNVSDALGLYTDTFYHLLSMCDETVQTKYNKKIKKISDNPSQTNIDTMSSNLVNIIIESMNEE